MELPLFHSETFWVWRQNILLDTFALYISPGMRFNQQYSIPVLPSITWIARDAPAHFTLAIEPLFIALRASTLFCGVRRWDTEYNVSLYADDLLLYRSDPVPSILHFLSILSVFRCFSGYKLNIQKSECFPINTVAQKYICPTYLFIYSNNALNTCVLISPGLFTHCRNKILLP